MKKLLLSSGVGSASMFAATAALGQTNQMMNGGGWGMGWMGGYGGIWLPVLLVVVVAAAVVVVMQRRRK